MFYELIYTRCQNGIDILSGKPLTNEGYKVYACSPELSTKGSLVDTELLLSAAQAKQSYSDVYSKADSTKPFMDEAYLYYVPDYGKSFMIEFHPVHYDADRAGNYTKKPGNFLNQIFVGDFGSFYAWELFGDTSVWNAKLNDEPYYYSVNPSSLPVRNLIPSTGSYTLDDIRGFISSGRKELLKKAVSFLLVQYALKPEERKYLVIRDSCSRNIELWIAAIQCAFSPLMSAGLPFASRLDNYPSANIYTVKALDGKYQPMMNFQDPNQRMRCRAMIVGVNMEDSSNNVPVMAFAARQCVVLDGVGMKAEFEAETSAEYFNVIARFDGEQGQFCLKFLQALNIRCPSPNLPELYRTFCSFRRIDTLSPQELSNTIKSLCHYDLTASPASREIYNVVKGNFGKITEYDLDAMITSAEWIGRNAQLMNDGEAWKYLSSIVCGLMKRYLFKGNHEIAEKILSGRFRKDVAADIISPETLEQFMLSDIPSEESLYFFKMFMKCSSIVGHKITTEERATLITKCMSLCEADWDTETMAKLMDFMSGGDNNNRSSVRDLILSCIKPDSEFAVNCILDSEPELSSSCAEAVNFCDMLNAKGLGHLAEHVLMRSIKVAKKLSELSDFAELIYETDYLQENAKVELFLALDGRVKFNSSPELARSIQKYRPEGAVCSNSANIMGLASMLARGRRSEPFRSIFQRYETQGFPNMMDEKFIAQFCDAFISLNFMNDDDYIYMHGLLFRKSTPRSILLGVLYEIISGAKKYPETWNDFLVYSSKYYREEAKSAVLDVLDEMPKKILKRLESAVQSKNKAASEMFAEIKELAELDNERKSKKGLLGKLAEFLFGDEDGE